MEELAASPSGGRYLLFVNRSRATAFDEVNGRQAVLLVPVSLAGVGDLAIVARKKKPTPMAVRVFVNVVSHGGLL